MTKRDVVRALMDRHGRTFAEELSIRLHRGTPSELFRLLCASILMSARISSDIAVAAARALFDAGWTTPQKMADATWKQRTRTLNRAGYARYDERTSSMLGETAELLQDRYRGDLRKLREEAERDPDRERALLKRFKGMGDTGVDIFFREAQAVWDELRPFADRRALAAAKRLDLGRDAGALSRLVSAKDFPTLVAALVRVKLEDGYEDVMDAS